MSHVYNVLEKLLTLVEENGAMLIDANLDVWADFSDCDAYVNWDKHCFEETTMLVKPFGTPEESSTDNPTSTGGADAASKGASAAADSATDSTSRTTDGPVLEPADDDDDDDDDDEPKSVAWRPIGAKRCMTQRTRRTSSQ